MKTTTLVTVIGTIAGKPERKKVNDKSVVDFRVEELGLRISAWEARADAVPDAGVIVVSGYLSTRTYMRGEEERVTTEIRATNIQVLDAAPALDPDLPF